MSREVDMLALLKKRRSIRKFQKKEVEAEKVEMLIKSALLSPTSRNLFPWEFIVVTDKQLLQKISNSKAHGSTFLKDAPLGIVVIANEEKSDVWVEDASIASIILQLAAESIGLGSCWIQIRKRMHSETQTSEAYVKHTLNIPKPYKVESIIAIGYPDEQRQPYNEVHLQYKKIHKEKYSS